MTDPLEKLATAHESVVALLQAIDPRILIRIACAAAGRPPGELIDVRSRNSRVEVPAVSRRAMGLDADLLYLIHESTNRVVESWIFEIQLSWSAEKRWTWALCEVAIEYEFRCEASLAVFSPDPELRRRIRIRLLPRMKTVGESLPRARAGGV